MNKKYISAIILVAIVTNIIVICVINQNKSIIFKKDKFIEVDKKKKYTKISIDKLVSEYKNEIYGDNKYKDKIFTVYGKLREIKIGDDYITVNLYCEQYTFDSVLCYLNNNDSLSELSKFKVDDIVTLTGVIRGKFYDIVIDGCIYNSGGNNNE